MANVTTLERTLWPLMDGPSITADHCVICGRHGHVEQHHVVRRGAGELYRDGRKLKKPTLTLCGFGNTSGCHGLAHANRLHFRVIDGWWWYLITSEPTKYAEALELPGWRPVRRPR